MSELHSKVHGRVLFTDDGGQSYDLGLPIKVGEAPYQCPRHVADALLRIAANADEYYLVSSDTAPASAEQPPAKPLAAAAVNAAPKLRAKPKVTKHGTA